MATQTQSQGTEVAIVTYVGGWQMSHTPSEMKDAHYTFGGGAALWGPIPIDEIPEGYEWDCAGGASPRPANLQECIDACVSQLLEDDRMVNLMRERNRPENVQDYENRRSRSIDRLRSLKLLKDCGWKGVIPSDDNHLATLSQQVWDNLNRVTNYQPYQHRLMKGNLLVLEDGTIDVFIPPSDDPNDRPCNCGSGQSWTWCNANSSYCG